MIIAPSVLSLDYSDFKNQLKALNKSVEWLHFDVMDGHFVPNLTFGPDIQRTFRKNTSLFIDTHIMVSNPSFISEIFAKAGSDQITFHYEATSGIEESKEIIEKIRSFYIKVGISIKPNTPVESIKELLPLVDTVLVMSVEPGFGGQSFIETSHEKIKALDALRKENDYKYLIEVDGGVNDQNSRQLVEEGTDVLVAGSFVFKGDIEHNVSLLRKTDAK